MSTSAWNPATGWDVSAGTVNGISGPISLVAGTNVTITDNSPSAGDIEIAASGGGGGSSTIGYAQITSPALVTDTSEATATALITAGPFTFDGTAVFAKFFSEEVLAPSSSFIAVTLFEGSTELTRLGVIEGITGAQNSGPMTCLYRFTPSAGSHTYKVCAFVASTAGSPEIRAGAGGTAGDAPAFLMFETA